MQQPKRLLIIQHLQQPQRRKVHPLTIPYLGIDDGEGLQHVVHGFAQDQTVLLLGEGSGDVEGDLVDVVAELGQEGGVGVDGGF